MMEPGHDETGRQPAPLLVEHLGVLPRGKVLDLAMGTGRNTLFLAERGFEVEGIDISADAVRRCLEEASRLGLRVGASVGDLAHYQTAPDSCEVILCFYFLDRGLIPQIKRALKPGGVLLYETFLIDQHLKLGRPRHQEYCLEHNELLRWFSDFRILYYREGWLGEEKATASLVAQKPAPAGCAA